jgi:hypothetical protein
VRRGIASARRASIVTVAVLAEVAYKAVVKDYLLEALTNDYQVDRHTKRQVLSQDYAT